MCSTMHSYLCFFINGFFFGVLFDFVVCFFGDGVTR